MNASGVACTTIQELDALTESAAGAYITKTGTIDPRDGNPRPRYWYNHERGTSQNAMGLPNNGLFYYIDWLVGRQPQAKKEGRLQFLSCAPMKGEDIPKILKIIQESDFEGITELNPSCPNIPGKSPIAFDPAQMLEMLEYIKANFKKPLGLKLPPYLDMAQMDAFAKMFNDYDLAHVNCCNSLVGTFIDTDGNTAIHANNGFGGIGGDPLYPVALMNVRKFREGLRPDIAVIGTGGVKDGETALAHIYAGADLIGIGTRLQEEGLGCFDRINEELRDLMRGKPEARSLDDLKRKVHVRDHHDIGM